MERPVFTASTISLLIANFIPLIGVLFLNWSLLSVLLIYWAESAVIGFFNIIKMVICRGQVQNNKNLRIINTATKFFLVPFFIVHYGIFMLVHFVFILVLGGIFGEASLHSTNITYYLSNVWNLEYFGIFLLAIFVSHGISFFTNFIAKKEYVTKLATEQMSAPYNRIMIMHFTIILGAVLAFSLGSSAGIILILCLLKTSIDFKAHVKEHNLYIPKKTS